MRGRTKSRATNNTRNRLEETAKIRRGKTMEALISKKADLIMYNTEQQGANEAPLEQE